jgi:hypothetical protein
MDVELFENVGDMGRDGPPGQQQPGSDRWVGQPLLQERGNLDLGRREAEECPDVLLAQRLTAQGAEQS